MRSRFIAVAGLLLLGSSDATPGGCQKCVANDCNRQVVASAFTTRHTRADCSSYLASTVTPSAVTISVTVTNAETVAVTVTETVVGTSLATETDTVPVTAVSTEIVTVTQDVFETISAAKTSVVLAPRIATSLLPNDVPAYASSCTAPGQYSSACSCIGVHPFTVTAVAPSTTVTVTVSPTVTVTQSATLSTLVTQTRTTAQTVTTTDVISESVTVTQTHTVTASPACTPTTAVFKLQYTNGGGTPASIQASRDGASSGPVYFVVNSAASAASATEFSIAPDGRLLDAGDPLFGGVPAYAYTNFDDDGDTIKFAPDNSIDYPDNFIQCSLDEATSSFSCNAGGNVYMSLTGDKVKISYFASEAGTVITLQPVIVIPGVAC